MISGRCGLRWEWVLIGFVAAGFFVRPTPLWAMMFYLAVMPVCGVMLYRVRIWQNLDRQGLVACLLIAWFTIGLAWDQSEKLSVHLYSLWILYGVTTCIFFLACRSLPESGPWGRGTLITVLITAGFLNAVWSLARNQTIGDAGHRLVGWAETRQAILGASIIGIGVLLALGRGLRSDGIVRLGYLVVVLVGVVFIIRTGSRGPLIAIVTTALSLLAVSRPQHLKTIGGAALMAAALVWVFAPDTITRIWLSLSERGWSSRLDIWELSLNEIGNRPLFGHGPVARLSRATDNFPHNLFLSTLFYSGIVGFVLLILALAMSWFAIRREPDVDLRWTLRAVWLHTVLSGITDLAQITKGPGPMWYIVWIPLALCMGPLSRAARRVTDDVAGSSPARVPTMPLNA